MEQRMEVHLYEFWGYGATAAGTIQQENLDLAGNNTWAICVPVSYTHLETGSVGVSEQDSSGVLPSPVQSPAGMVMGDSPHLDMVPSVFLLASRNLASHQISSVISSSISFTS